MAVTHRIIELNNTTALPVSVTGTHAGRDITIQNISSVNYVYLGGEGVTPTNYGYRIRPNAAWSVELREKEIIYAVASDTSSVAVIELGLETGD